MQVQARPRPPGPSLGDWQAIFAMRTVTRAAISLALLGLFVGWFLLLRPTLLGGPASYVIVSGQSMEPTLHSSDLAVLQKRSDYGPGDIVAFRVLGEEFGEGNMIIHRIVGGNAEEGYIVQGDNKERPDFWRPTDEDMMGRMWFSIPRGGHLLAFLAQPLILGSVVGGLGMLSVLSGGLGKPSSPSGPSQSRPSSSACGDPPGTRLTLRLVLAGALTRALGFLRKRDRGRLS
jgi:signal peptidase